jgi:hypothetical protein
MAWYGEVRSGMAGEITKVDPSFKILTTDWGTRTVLAYLDD